MQASRITLARACLSDVYRFYDLVNTVTSYQEAAILKYGSPSQLGGTSQGNGDGKMGKRSGKMQGGTMTLAGWSDAACGDQSSLGKCHLGYVIGLMSPTLRGPCHFIQWASKFTRKSAKSSLGGAQVDAGPHVDALWIFLAFYIPLSRYGLPRELLKSLCAPREQESNHGKVRGSTFFRHTASYRTEGIGQCVLASGPGKPCGWIDQDKE